MPSTLTARVESLDYLLSTLTVRTYSLAYLTGTLTVTAESLAYLTSTLTVKAESLPYLPSTLLQRSLFAHDIDYYNLYSPAYLPSTLTRSIRQCGIWLFFSDI